jgi:hypothetical protein
MKNDSQQTNVKSNAAAQKPRAPQPNGQKADGHGRTGSERKSLSEERAEGEGMIAPPDADQAMEGEGSYTATRRYDEGVAKSVAAGDTEKLAKEAAQALDGPEGTELRKAEQAAKQGHST